MLHLSLRFCSIQVIPVEDPNSIFRAGFVQLTIAQAELRQPLKVIVSKEFSSLKRRATTYSMQDNFKEATGLKDTVLSDLHITTKHLNGTYELSLGFLVSME